MAKMKTAKTMLARVRESLAVVIAIAVHVAALQGDEFVGRVLVPIDQMESAIEAGVGALLMRDRDKVRGSIKEVKVTESNETTITLEITYRGFENAEFRGEVLDPQKRAIRTIESTRFPVPAGDTNADRTAKIRFELKPGTEAVPELQSSRVKFRIGKAGSQAAQFVNVYGLDKRWSSQVAPLNVVVKFTPTPIGSTAAWVQTIRSPSPAPPVVVGPPRRVGSPVTPIVSMRTATLPDATRAAVLRRDPMPGAPVAVMRAPTLTSTSSVATAKAVGTKNQAVIAQLPRTKERIAIGNYRFAQVVPVNTPTSTEPTNQVTASYVDLLGQLTTEGVEIQPSEILGVFSRVYPDSNANSGVFYYIPRAYRLAYNSDVGGSKGLGFRIGYDRRREDDEKGRVRMAASFDSAVDLNEIRLAEKILQSIDSQDSTFKFTPPLRAFPLAAPPQFDFSGALQGFVKSDQIAVVALSDSLEGMDLSWSTDPVDAQNIRRDLRDGIPISGVAAFDAPNSDAPTLIVPARVELTDPVVYKALKWSRTDEIRNGSPLPVILKHLHAFVIENNRPRLYSWDLADTVVPSQARLELNLANVPPQVDSKAERVWIQYTLDRRCEDCISRIVDDIVSGDLWPNTGKVVIRTLTPLETIGAAEIWADVRSRFFDPTDRTPTDGPRQHMNKDRAEYTIDPIFLTNRVPPGGGAAWPLFEYRLIVVMPDGAQHEGTTWVSSESETVVIGPVQIEQSLGFVPGRS